MPLALIMTSVILIAGLYQIVSAREGEEHIIIDPVIVNMDGQEYVVNDLLNDPGGDCISTEVSEFDSFEELQDIVNQEGREDWVWMGNRENDSGIVMAEGLSAASSDGAGGNSYSTTNIQVDGVDEGDIVKNDDKYAYIASRDRGSLFIIDVYPPEKARILSEIRTNGSIQDIYLSDDKLIVISQTFYFSGGYYESDCIRSDRPTIIVQVFDVWDRSNPVLLRDASLIGYFTTSRVIDNKLYLIADHYSYGGYENESQLPLPIDCLYYIEDESSYYSLTNFMSLDFTDASAKPYVMGIFMSDSNTIYVSQKNIYITHLRPREYSNADDVWSVTENEEATVVHRIGIQGQGLKYRARGEVPGRVLNRFSMDEHNGHFRIATTKGRAWSSAHNMVHVLDMALNTTGKLENIAPNETIYSARFMGDRCYLVTFRQIDPFFVIDLHDAENPEILGELKIPGYSSYLHPYDEDHVIGLGMDGSRLKVSLFNVTDVENPTELDNYQIGDSYSYSSALRDPHAFTFSRERNLLVIPAYVNDYDGGGSRVLVLEISPEDGIAERGRITHQSQELDYDSWGVAWGYRNTYNPIKRSFFIDDVLYTVSDQMIKANDIENLEELASVALITN